MPKLPCTLIIDGHGETYDPKSEVKANYFNFKRSAATKCTLHSYVREGALMPANESNKKILSSVNGNGLIPTPVVETNESRIGGIRLRDRILYAIDYDNHGNLDWNYQLPSSWGAKTIELPALQGGTVETIVWYNGTDEKSSSVVWLALRAEGPNTPLRSVLLSKIIEYFNTQSYDILWMVCREG